MSTGDFPTLDPNDPQAAMRESYSTGLLNQFNESLRDPVQVGPYKIVRELGAGGMGSVFLAEQESPVRRMVALKLIRAGMDTREVLARFEAERQALAIMEHPNIARVMDAGATELGRPYFVMEYVKGEPITTFCDRQNFTTRQRLELFSQACDAIGHAHTKGIIHRDVKPSNVLVSMQSGTPMVKVIDFGVAKATNQRLTEKTLFTEVGQIVGTPEYMSPEQAEMSVMDIDTRSDIYSLRVLLYELLTGALPFDPKTLRSMAYAEMQRAIRELDPPKPSTRLSSLAADRAGEIANRRNIRIDQLTAELRDELEWIPLKAMRKDRSERYRTAAELADDVQNYLHARPLIAGPESAAYRVRKFMRRNRRPVVATSVVTALIIATIITSMVVITRARNREREQRMIAEQNFTRAEENFRTANRAVFDFFTAVRQENLLNTPALLPLQKKLLESAVLYTTQFTESRQNDPARESELAQAYNTLGVVRTDLKQFADAIDSLDRSISIRRKLLDKAPLDPAAQYALAGTLNNLAAAHRDSGAGNRAVPIYAAAASMYEVLISRNPQSALKYTADLATVHRNLAKAYNDQGDYPAAIAAYQKSIDASRRLVQGAPSELRYQIELADALFDQGIAFGNVPQSPQSIAAITEARDLRLKMLSGSAMGNTHVMVGLARDYSMLADKQLQAGDKAASDESINRAADIWKSLIGDRRHFGINAGLARAFGTLAWTQLRLNDPKAAIDSARAALQADDSQHWIAGNLAHALLINGQFDEAKTIYLQLKDRNTNPGETGREMILEDFKLLTDAGVVIPRRGEIEEMLGVPTTAR